MLEHRYLFNHEHVKVYKVTKDRIRMLCYANMIGEKERLLLVKIKIRDN